MGISLFRDGLNQELSVLFIFTVLRPEPAKKFQAKVIVKTTENGFVLAENETADKRKPYFFLVN